jgi:hypothetical protein
MINRRAGRHVPCGISATGRTGGRRPVVRRSVAGGQRASISPADVPASRDVPSRAASRPSQFPSHSRALGGGRDRPPSFHRAWSHTPPSGAERSATELEACWGTLKSSNLLSSASTLNRENRKRRYSLLRVLHRPEVDQDQVRYASKSASLPARTSDQSLLMGVTPYSATSVLITLSSEIRPVG